MDSNVSRPHRMNDQVYSIIFVLQDAVLPVVAVPGMICSLLSIIVFRRKRMSCSLNSYLAGVGLFDFILLFSACLIYPPMAWCMKYRTQWVCNFFYQSSLFAFPSSVIAHFGSVWMCVLITADRFLVVKYPLRSRFWCTSRRASFAVLALGGTSIVYNIPVLFELQINETNGRIDSTQLRKNPDYKIYKAWMFAIVHFLVPLFLMVLLNYFVIVEIRRMHRNRNLMMAHRAIKTVHQTADTQDKDRRSTMMAILVIGTFVIFNVPALISAILEICLPDRHHFFRLMLVQVGNIFVCLNSAANFLIYCGMSKRFRFEFQLLFCRCVPVSYSDYSLHYSTLPRTLASTVAAKRSRAAASSKSDLSSCSDVSPRSNSCVSAHAPLASRQSNKRRLTADDVTLPSSAHEMITLRKQSTTASSNFLQVPTRADFF